MDDVEEEEILTIGLPTRDIGRIKILDPCFSLPDWTCLCHRGILRDEEEAEEGVDFFFVSVGRRGGALSPFTMP